MYLLMYLFFGDLLYLVMMVFIVCVLMIVLLSVCVM